MFKIATIFVLFYSSYSDGKQFRFDYKYYSEAEGWLKLHQVPANWHEARLRCHYEGAVLASPSHAKLVAAMKTHMRSDKEPPCSVFSGVHATFSRGDYFSIEGVPLAKMSITWAPDEPDNLNDSESCLIFLLNGTMADVKCSDTYPYMCYKKKTTMVVTGCGTIDNQYNLDTRTGSCYKFHRTGQTWSRAFMTCAAEGGHLVIVNSDTEAQVLKELFTKNPINTISSDYGDHAAVGFHDWGEHGTWLTIHDVKKLESRRPKAECRSIVKKAGEKAEKRGSNADARMPIISRGERQGVSAIEASRCATGETLEGAGFAKWAGGQPNNITRSDVGQSCGSITNMGAFDDIWCNINLAFICEMTPETLNKPDEVPFWSFEKK